jgi:hypothetical protein
MALGEAKGHGLNLDNTSLDQFLDLAVNRRDGIKVRFGADHDAGASDINGSLKNFRRDGDKIRADLYLLKSDRNFAKIIEMAEKLPNEFGLSASTTADEEVIGKEKFVRFKEIFCVDIVSNPAATNGLFFSQTHNNQPNMLKEFAVMLGLPETATEADVKVALEAKCKLSDEAKKKAEDEEKKKIEADDEAAGKQGKKFEALEAQLLELSNKLAGIETNSQAAKDAAHKAEIEGLKLEASKDGKVIPMNDEALLKLSIPEIKDMISKLSKGQVKLSRGVTVPTNKDGKSITDKRSPEFKAFLQAKQAEGALALGQRMTATTNLNQN